LNQLAKAKVFKNHYNSSHLLYCDDTEATGFWFQWPLFIHAATDQTNTLNIQWYYYEIRIEKNGSENQSRKIISAETFCSG